jgi:NADPH-dependent 2,4-dienoyl-CoA reductase/sulfur reductase-like enzyme
VNRHNTGTRRHRHKRLVVKYAYPFWAIPDIIKYFLNGINLRFIYSTTVCIMEVINVDVLVCGGGMSGMACAAFTADAGAKTMVVEKQGTVGGSSNYSAGMLYVSDVSARICSRANNSVA